MKALIKTLPLALLLTLAGTAQAADTPAAPAPAPAPAPGPGPARHMDPAAITARMSTDLGLSQEQTAKVEKINQSFAQRFAEQRREHEAMRKQHREAMRKLGGERDQELKKVLTDEQYSKLVEQRKATDASRREHQGRGPGKGHRPEAAPAETSPPPAK